MHRLRGDNVHEILGAIGPVGQNGDSDVSRVAGFLSAISDDFSTSQFQKADFHQNWTRESVTPRNMSEMILENFPFRGHWPPKALKLNGGNSP